MKQVLAQLLAVLLLASWGLADSISPTTIPSGSTTPAAVIDIHGAINDFTAKQFFKRFDEAKAKGAKVIILHLDTPGGAVGAALEMSRFLKREGKNVHTIAYVDPMAYSAGSMIALACREIAMSPGSVMGDCAPILMSETGGLEQITGAERAKMESPIVADFEESAAINGYDALLARSFVQYKIVVHYIENEQGQKKFVRQEEYDRLIKEGWKSVEGVNNPIDDDSTLLTVSDKTAKLLGLSKETYDDLAAMNDVRGYQVLHRFQPTFGDNVIAVLNSGVVRLVLSIVFILSLQSAYSHPGTGVTEAILVISGSMLLGIPLLTGYASWIEIILIMLGIALIAMEIFVIPGFGVPGITGIVLLLAGLVMTFVPSEAPALPTGPSIVPQLPQTKDALWNGLLVVMTGMIVSMGLWYWLSRYLHKVPYMNRLVLQTVVGSTPDAATDYVREVAESNWPAIGAVGVVITELRPGGVARFEDVIINDGRNVDVISDLGYIAAGKRVIVKRHDGPEIYVRPHEGAA